MSPADADPLRLSFCPACGYPFDGLPHAGQCPECGRDYDADQPWVVLRGHQQFAGVLPFVSTVPLAVLIAGLLWFGGGRVDAAVMFPIGLLSLTLSAVIVVRLTNDWPNRWLLWLSPAGWAWQSTFAPGVLIRRLAAAAMAVLIVGGVWRVVWRVWHALVVTVGQGSRATAILLGLVGAYGLLTWAGRWLTRRLLFGPRHGRSSRRTLLGQLWQQSRPLGEPPPAIPWTQFEVVTLRPCRGGRYRFTAGRRGRWCVVPLIQVDVDLSPAAAVALVDRIVDRIDAWRRTAP